VRMWRDLLMGMPLRTIKKIRPPSFLMWAGMAVVPLFIVSRLWATIGLVTVGVGRSSIYLLRMPIRTEKLNTLKNQNVEDKPHYPIHGYQFLKRHDTRESVGYLRNFVFYPFAVCFTGLNITSALVATPGLLQRRLSDLRAYFRSTRRDASIGKLSVIFLPT